MKAQRKVLRALALTMLAVVLATSSVLPGGLALAQQDERIAVVQAAMAALQTQLPLAEGLYYAARAVNVDGDWGVVRFLVYRTSDSTPPTSDLTDLVSRHVMHPRTYTWYKEWSDYCPGRLDYIIYTDNMCTKIQNKYLCIFA